MRDDTQKEYLLNMVNSGEFGEYLTNPMNNQDRLKEVGDNLLYLRKKADLSQKELCQIIGCAVQTYSGYENARHEPSIETLVRLAHIYNISVDYIVGTKSFDEDLKIYEEVDNIVENPKFEDIQTQMQLMKNDIEHLKWQIDNKNKKFTEISPNVFIEEKINESEK